ncbi:hypothetical protein IE077_001624, partial [Cardiosporidium cionae]
QTGLLSPQQLQVPALLAQGKSLPQPPRINTALADKIDTQQHLLVKQLETEETQSQQLLSDVKALKSIGLKNIIIGKKLLMKQISTGAVTKQQGVTVLHPNGVGSAIMQATSAGTPNSGVNFAIEMEAPIVLVETPPLLPEEQLEVISLFYAFAFADQVFRVFLNSQADHSSECMLQRVGDESSPAMKAAREYELKKLGEVSSHSLAETQNEIRETQSGIKNKKREREIVYNRF